MNSAAHQVSDPLRFFKILLEYFYISANIEMHFVG